MTNSHRALSAARSTAQATNDKHNDMRSIAQQNILRSIGGSALMLFFYFIAGVCSVVELIETFASGHDTRAVLFLVLVPLSAVMMDNSIREIAAGIKAYRATRK